MLWIVTIAYPDSHRPGLVIVSADTQDIALTKLKDARNVISEQYNVWGRVGDIPILYGYTLAKHIEKALENV